MQVGSNEEKNGRRVVLKPPITVGKAKSMLKEFTSAVVLALKGLHEQGIAHLDIRLENICFNHGKVVFIELDKEPKGK